MTDITARALARELNNGVRRSAGGENARLDIGLYGRACRRSVYRRSAKPRSSKNCRSISKTAGANSLLREKPRRPLGNWRSASSEALRPWAVIWLPFDSRAGRIPTPPGASRPFSWDGLMADLRQAVRALRAAPAFTIVALVVLTLGIGATTAIFSVVDAVVLRALPFDKHDRLVAVGERGSFWRREGLRRDLMGGIRSRS